MVLHYEKPITLSLISSAWESQVVLVIDRRVPLNMHSTHSLLHRLNLSLWDIHNRKQLKLTNASSLQYVLRLGSVLLSMCLSLVPLCLVTLSQTPAIYWPDTGSTICYSCHSTLYWFLPMSPTPYLHCLSAIKAVTDSADFLFLYTITAYQIAPYSLYSALILTKALWVLWVPFGMQTMALSRINSVERLRHWDMEKWVQKL
jgi:hypothetical protein